MLNTIQILQICFYIILHCVIINSIEYIYYCISRIINNKILKLDNFELQSFKD